MTSQVLFSAEQYSAIERLWPTYLVEIDVEAELSNAGVTTRGETSSAAREEEEGDAAQLKADVTTALHIIQRLKQNTAEWWEWFTVLNGSLKARFICLCMNDEGYCKRRKLIFEASEFICIAEEDTDTDSNETAVSSSSSVELKKRDSQELTVDARSVSKRTRLI